MPEPMRLWDSTLWSKCGRPKRNLIGSVMWTIKKKVKSHLIKYGFVCDRNFSLSLPIQNHINTDTCIKLNYLSSYWIFRLVYFHWSRETNFGSHMNFVIYTGRPGGCIEISKWVEPPCICHIQGVSERSWTEIIGWIMLINFWSLSILK